MSLTLKTILLGVALAAATPIAHNATLSQRSAASLVAILPNGLAPIHMAEVVDIKAELAKCNFDEYADCRNRRRKDCDDIVDNSSNCEIGGLIKVIGIREGLANLGGGFAAYSGSEATETQTAGAGALVARAEKDCGNKCAGWATMPPWGVWFGVCMLDCHKRCKNGGRCP